MDKKNICYWTWEPSLSVGIEAIDEQHRRIVDYLNELHVAHVAKDHDRVTQFLKGLTDYTVSHFEFEESLMQKAGYPLSDSHKRVHESFTAHIGEYKERHENGEDVARRLMSELRIWLTNHIKKDDTDYAPYVRKVQHRGWLGKRLRRLFA